MESPPVSVVIVSRGRPELLDLCLTGVSQLDYPRFEVIVVACPQGMARAQARPDAHHLKLVAFDEPNISVARNLGIAQAAGEIVAFVDDDAVPEPLWLSHLAAPFSNPDLNAAAGYVLGRNGMEFQWTARTVDTRLEEVAFPVEGDAPIIVSATAGCAIKSQGTNMAHRRTTLARLGGFDPAFRFFLDDTDLDMRLARSGATVAVVPRAQVHHGYAASSRRGPDRTPRDLTEIGASIAVFLRKHCSDDERPAAWRAIRSAQRHRLLRWMARGPLGPDVVVSLMRGLDRGYSEGTVRDIPRMAPISEAESDFLPYPGRVRAERVFLSGRVWNRAALRRAAIREAADGRIVSVFRFSHTALYHRLRFRPGGYWEQWGGLWGKSARSGALVQPWSFKRRIRSEADRIAETRGNSRSI